MESPIPTNMPTNHWEVLKVWHFIHSISNLRTYTQTLKCLFQHDTLRKNQICTINMIHVYKVTVTLDTPYVFCPEKNKWECFIKSKAVYKIHGYFLFVMAFKITEHDKSVKTWTFKPVVIQLPIVLIFQMLVSSQVLLG